MPNPTQWPASASSREEFGGHNGQLEGLDDFQNGAGCGDSWAPKAHRATRSRKSDRMETTARSGAACRRRRRTDTLDLRQLLA